MSFVPIAYFAHLKQIYDNMEMLLTAVEYGSYQWNICDLKAIEILMYMQSGLKENVVFLCLWDSRVAMEHYTDND